MPRLETRDGERFWEVEVVDAAVETCEGTSDGSKTPRVKSTAHDNEDEARYAAARMIVKRQRRGFKLVGPARHAGGGNGLAPPPPSSAIALDEFFATADGQFLGEMLRSNAASKLAAF